MQESGSEKSAEESDRTFSIEDQEEEKLNEDTGGIFDEHEGDSADGDVALRVYDARYKIPA